MAQEVVYCRCCGEFVQTQRPGAEPFVYVKRKGVIYYYHEKCVKGGGRK